MEANKRLKNNGKFMTIQEYKKIKSQSDSLANKLELLLMYNIEVEDDVVVNEEMKNKLIEDKLKEYEKDGNYPDIKLNKFNTAAKRRLEKIKEKGNEHLKNEHQKLLNEVEELGLGKGKIPHCESRNKPVFITINNEQVLAVTDGNGHAYKVYGEGYDVYDSICLIENIYDPNDYEFDRFLRGMDF